MKILRVIFVIAVLCAPFYAQQVNQDIVPASPGLYLGHTNQRWNGYFNNADIYNLTINGSPIGTAGVGLPQISIPNGANCTTLNGLVEFDGNGQAQTASLSSTKVIGVAVSGAGCSGNVLVQYAAIVNCTTDGSTLINDRIAASNSIPGDCMDIGPISIPGIQTVGLVTAVSSGAGQLTSFDLFTGDTISPSSSSGSGVVSVSPCVGPIGYAATAAAIVSWDCNTSLDGSGNAGFKKVTVTGSGAGKIDFGTSTTPGNPSAGFDRIYGDSTSGLMKCLTSGGGNCFPTTVLDFCSNGGVCDNSTDDTTAFNAALTTLFNQGGGILFIAPGKTSKLAGQITIPRDATGPLNMTRPIRITGTSPNKYWGTNVPPGTPALNLTFNAANGKIMSQGLGYLEIDHLTLTDTAADCATFIYTTLTTGYIHDVAFHGTAASASACNDAIILGGTDTSTGNTITSAFNGYGYTIENNFFNNMARIVVLQSFANGVNILHNTIDTDCGWPTGAAFELIGVVTNSTTGNVFDGNLIEVTHYKYAFWGRSYATSNQFAYNGIYDNTGSTASFRFEATSQGNFIIDNVDAVATQISDANAGTNAASTYITSKQNIPSIIPQPWTWYGSVVTEKGGDSQTAFDIFNTADNTETYWQAISGANPSTTLNMKPSGGTAKTLLTYRRNSTNGTYLDIGDSSDGDERLRTASSTTDLRLMTTGSGQVVWLCGGAGVCKTWVNNAGQINNNVSIGTAPMVITSTTNVANLNASSVNGNTFPAPGPIGGTTPGSGTFTAVSTASGQVSGNWNCTNVTPVTINTNTAADQNMMACTIPAATLNSAGRTLRVYAAGVYSTPAASTSQMTMKAKLCTVSGCGSGTVITPISIQSTVLGTVQITNDNFSMHSNITTQTVGASSAYEAHGEFLIDLATLTTAADSSFGDTNTATVGTIDATGQLFLQMTFAFSNASGSNSATQRQLIVDTVN